VNNRDVARYFDNIADLLEIKGEGIHRVMAYRRAAESLRALGQDLHDLQREGKLETIQGVGKAIAAKIEELLDRGRLEFYERLTNEIPESLIEILQVQDVGPKKAAQFWKELGITTLEQLEAAASQGELHKLKGMGMKSEARILENIEAMKRRQTDRFRIGDGWDRAQVLIAGLRSSPDVAAVELAGSLRRWKETVGDLDLIVASKQPKQVMDLFAGLPQVGRILGHGETKCSAELVDGMRVQLWVHPPERYGSALQYATGSQAHNVRLRELALDQGLSLSEHGFRREDGSEILCALEEEVYKTLGVPWIPPALREDQGEVRAALEGRLPDLIEVEHLRGDLHTHSTWSDGQNTILEMGRAAADLGYSYLGITDHSRSLGIASGLSEDDIREQAEEIASAQDQLGSGLRLLRGAEVEILADGALDFEDELLAELDLVIASLHTSLRQPQKAVTERMLAAIQNPHVDIIAHPTGRLIQMRDPAALDLPAILEAAAEHQVALEINAHPDRLDLNAAHARMAAEAGCLLSVNTDAHQPSHLPLRRFGVGIAQRAWVTPGTVINTWSFEQLITWLKGRK
jgi:DNA polymerase (family 10)